MADMDEPPELKRNIDLLKENVKLINELEKKNSEDKDTNLG
jgi:hypothetical protein